MEHERYNARARGNQIEESARSKWLYVFLIALTVYLPNQAQFRIEFPIKGINVANFLFIAIAVLIPRGRARPITPIRGPIFFFILTLVWAFCVGQIRDSDLIAEDVTILKNAIFYILIYFLYYHAIDDRLTIERVYICIILVIFTSILLGIRQALDYGLGTYNESKRVAAPFGWGISDANRAAVYFCIYLPIIACSLLYEARSKIFRLACWVSLPLGVFVIFQTFSRQSYFIIAVLALLLGWRRNWVLGFIVCVALISYEQWVPESALARIQMTSAEEAKTGGNAGEEARYDESTESRFILWEGALELVQENPFGIGLNHFKRMIGSVVPSWLEGKDAHNFYVLIATEGGIFAPLVLLILLCSLYRLGFNLEITAKDALAKSLGTSLCLSVLAVAMGNVYGSRFLDGDVMGMFWILAALCARLHTIQLEEVNSRTRTVE